MTELNILGVGTWSPYFSNWGEFSNGLIACNWQQGAVLQPDLIPARERRRAPQSVKMAVEVMHQSCEMAGLRPTDVATVFSSSMGDMEITDYMCRTLAENPRAISPTKFHNSVHNASTGYWSIATQSHRPANAISAHAHSASMAFLEGAIQATEENIPVLVVVQEMATPITLLPTCQSQQSFSAAILIAPTAVSASPIASVHVSVSREKTGQGELPAGLEEYFSGNSGAILLPLFAALASQNDETSPVELRFPLSADLCLNLDVKRQ